MKQAISDFENYLLIQKGYSKLTAKAYRHDLKRFDQYLQSKNNIEFVEHISSREIYDFLGYLAQPNDNKKPNSAITRARKLATIRSFFNYLNKYYQLTSNPCSLIEMPTVPLKEPEYLTESEYLRFIQTIKEEAKPFYKDRDLAIALMFLGTGIRVSELTELELTNINLEQSSIKVHRKGNKEQTIPLNNSVKRSLYAYLNVRPKSNIETVFISRKKSKLQTNSVYHLVKKYLKLAKIKKRKHGPHILRHTCFTSLLSKNINPVIIQQLAGHNSFDTTRRYLHLNNKQVRDAVNQINLEEETNSKL